MQTVHVNTKSHAYPIYIGSGLLADSELLQRHLRAKQVMLVSNETVAPYYLEKIQQGMGERQCDSVILPDGEQYKDIATLNRIFDELIAKKHHRNTTLVAIGGGVIGDMTGFAAACYQRGVDFIQIPTSLLAQVDASVGGKTGVNHKEGKNMIGAFYQPQCVIIDIDTLNTLPNREFYSGLAEVIKHGLVRDADFFNWLEDNMPKLVIKEQAALTNAILRCCEIKAEIVSLDEREQGIRAILNLGHTVGHAIETGLGYGQWLHGETVAIGMVVAARISANMGCLQPITLKRIIDCIKNAKLPITLHHEMTMTECNALMALDKKIVENNLRFVLLKQIGEAFVTSDVQQKTLHQALLACGFAQ